MSDHDTSRPVSLEDIRAANISRAKEWHGDENTPNIEYRFMELAGEVGEACNAQKKRQRAAMGIRGGVEDTLEDVKEELADVLICLDLVAMDLGIDLGDAVRDKFNKTSEKYGLSVRMS